MAESPVGNVGRMEGADGAVGLSAQSQGLSYEQITDSLKSQASGESDTTLEQDTSPETTTDPETPETPETPEEFRRLTEDEKSALPPEVQAHFKRVERDMQAAYTRKTQDAANLRKKADTLERLDTDPVFRAQYLAQYAPPAPPVAPAAPATPPVAPPEYVEMRRKTLPSEMAWMADALALGDYQRDQALYAKHIAPIQQQAQLAQRAQAEHAYQAATQELATKFPEWDAAQDDMVDVVRFIASPALKHPKFGNKLELIYRMVTADGAEAKAVVETMERTARAAKAGSVTAKTTGRSTAPNLPDRVRDASNDGEAWEAIKQAHAGR